MLGEALYPFVFALDSKFAGKITGMLLEMDNADIVNLLESPEALAAKVAEARDVLLRHYEGSFGSQFDTTIASYSERELALAAEQERDEKNAIGELLYVRIQQLGYTDTVGKLTGMLLEMDISYLAELMGSEELLVGKVEEAAEVLAAHMQGI